MSASSTNSIITLAGGMGLGPIHFLSKQIAEQNLTVNLFYGVQDAERIAVKTFPNSIKAVIATDDGSFGEKGFITDILILAYSLSWLMI